jgi:hypothetical protein
LRGNRPTVPRKVVEGLDLWFHGEFGKHLLTLGHKLIRPTQFDGHSCSICTMNTIAHGIFGDPLWMQDSAPRYRIAWFNELAKFEASAALPVCGFRLHRSLVYPPRIDVLKGPRISSPHRPRLVQNDNVVCTKTGANPANVASVRFIMPPAHLEVAEAARRMSMIGE